MVHIKKIKIKNSPFFENIEVEFSKKLNCMMGGRGTGKTTLLYFLMSALKKEIENDSLAFSLLRNNLDNGIIEVEIISKSGKKYKIRKSLNDEPQPYYQDQFQKIDKILDEIKCDFYKTGEIENIGRDPLGRLKLIDTKVTTPINDKMKDINKIQRELDTNSQEIRSLNAHSKELEESLKDYSDVEEIFKEHKEQKPKTLKKEEKEEFEKADQREKQRSAERRLINNVSNKYGDLQSELKLTRDEFNEFFSERIADKSDYLNEDIISGLIDLIHSVNKKINTNFESTLNELESCLSKISEYENKVDDIHDKQQAKFIELKQKFEESKDYLDKYNRLTNRIDKKKQIQQELNDIKKKAKQKKGIRESLVKKLNDKKDEIFKIRRETINELNELFNGEILIRISAGGITEQFTKKLQDALVGSGLKYNQLIPNIIDSFTPDKFARVIHEKDIESLKSISGIDSSRSETLINALHETKNIYDIEKIYLPDLPEFLLKIKNIDDSSSDSYKETELLSMGQRCTTVLPIIFAVSENPLIIDQPEDNLDNKYIASNIHKVIREQKVKRQLIFITHNPNIPVLSNAEKNIFLDFKEKAYLSQVGGIDDVKDNIIDLLEGGKEAFQRRSDIYGF